jgi:hypothetical protein
VAQAAQLPKIAVLPVQLDPSAKDKVPALIDDYLLAAAQDVGTYQVIGPDDINAMLGFEKQKNMLGCDEASCFAELGGALGVDEIATLRVARLENDWVVTGKLIDIRRTVVVRRVSEFVPGETRNLLEGLRPIVGKLLLGGNPANAPKPSAAASSAPKEEPRAAAPETPTSDTPKREPMGLSAGLGLGMNLVLGTAAAGYVEASYRVGESLDMAVFLTSPLNVGLHLRVWTTRSRVRFGPIISVVKNAAGLALAAGLSMRTGWQVGSIEIGGSADAQLAYSIGGGFNFGVPFLLSAYVGL